MLQRDAKPLSPKYAKHFAKQVKGLLGLGFSLSRAQVIAFDLVEGMEYDEERRKRDLAWSRSCRSIFSR